MRNRPHARAWWRRPRSRCMRIGVAAYKPQVPLHRPMVTSFFPCPTASKAPARCVTARVMLAPPGARGCDIPTTAATSRACRASSPPRHTNAKTIRCHGRAPHSVRSSNPLGVRRLPEATRPIRSEPAAASREIRLQIPRAIVRPSLVALWRGAHEQGRMTEPRTAARTRLSPTRRRPLASQPGRRQSVAVGRWRCPLAPLRFSPGHTVGFKAAPSLFFGRAFPFRPRTCQVAVH